MVAGEAEVTTVVAEAKEEAPTEEVGVEAEVPDTLKTPHLTRAICTGNLGKEAGHVLIVTIVPGETTKAPVQETIETWSQEQKL